jgi:catechol 2,3-dioxygenase-like lactoylglutathione lyase family enzyme
MTPSACQLQRAMPVLEITQIARSIAFYRDKLGFDADTWGEPPTFAIVQRGLVTLALALVDPPAAVSRRTWAAYLYPLDVDVLYAELVANGVVIPHPPETRFYNCREFVVDDPDGHIICFGQELNPGQLGPGLGKRVGRDANPTGTP